MAGKAGAEGVRIRVEGVVQGVGFRPFVRRLADAHGLSGQVWNEAGDVVIEALGETGAIAAFVEALRRCPPPAAAVEALRIEPALDLAAYPAVAFRIVPSRSGGERALGVGPDLATCATCREETLDSGDRRYRYPFTNCLGCGPRLSILEGTPYDRPQTTMAAFRMCGACRREYDDPRDRRFHAQPNACPACGPRAWLELVEERRSVRGWPAIRHAFWDVVRGGGSVAIKGIGGYHLACLATDETAVRRLRERKHRPDKPLAVMAGSLAALRRHCVVTPVEAGLLLSPAAPILLLRPRDDHPLAPSVAPRQHRIGAMLPYTPLHHLLFEGRDEVLVMTSGNLADRPQITDDAEAGHVFAGVADAILSHDRRIAVRVDDSVARVDGHTPTWLRLGRGTAPLQLPVPDGAAGAADVVALGAQLKATFCLKRKNRLVLAQHIGDLSHAENRDALAASLRHYLRLHDLRPEVIALDLHPEVGSARLAEELAAETGAAPVRVQHHHAHAAACLAEHGHPLSAGPVLAIVMDGLGYGADGTLWGFEFMVVDYTGFRRLAHLRPVPMPGGEAAIRAPWRMALAHLAADRDPFELRTLPLFRDRDQHDLDLLVHAMRKGINAPLTSSAGRLFDAVAALAGVCTQPSYEGQPAAELEAALWRERRNIRPDDGYRLEIDEGGPGLPVLDPLPLFDGVLQDLARGRSPGEIALRFHVGLVRAILAMTEHVTALDPVLRGAPVALSGGVFQNGFLLRALRAMLARQGFRVLSHRRLPANDGGVSVGQAVVGAAAAKEPISACA